MGGVLGWLGGYSPAIIFMLALGAFALIALGLNNITQWIVTRSPADKLRSAIPSVGVNLDESVKPPKLKGIKLGVIFHNAAHFPLEIRIDELETQIRNRVPAEKFFCRSVVVYGPTGGAQFHNAQIELDDLDLRNQTIYGEVKAKAPYGRPGKLRYLREYRTYLAFKFDGEGNLTVVEPSLTEFSVEQKPRDLPSVTRID